MMKDINGNELKHGQSVKLKLIDGLVPARVEMVLDNEIIIQFPDGEKDILNAKTIKKTCLRRT